MIDLDDMRCFVEVVDCGSLSAAATRLNISKSVVSRKIARIEDLLGTRLLDRTTRGIAPTEAGLEFKSRSERILLEYEETLEAISEHSNEIVGELRLSVPLAFGTRHLGPVLASLACRYPRLKVDASFSDRVVDLIGERFDAVIRIGHLRDSSYIARKIAPISSIVVASPTYLERNGTPQSPEDLTAHDCLIYTAALSPDWVFQSGNRKISVRPSGRLRTDNGDTTVAWAVAGLGIAHAPLFLVNEAVERGDLVPLLLDYPTPEVGLYVLRAPGANTPRKVRVLIDALVENVSGKLNWADWTYSRD
ncbi:transcriptional regulatory protein [Stappia aggregata IAM 12614]|uniref:Transcriptional regulatory protein n=1 Tax=Roseibium aggregatum (strain ATCC 25650 / DSM 13394 / JCM 20685 / NBRC 16684 / NCIMB 2208 / IAM 12614 / B1) TaxID=384765 RepID=A0P156_ROSAI|nr:LysR family transcriptional regulator [Roseibium aggregatum]EAV41241.1 transcriptional regulatory protein [Stappia aggregata IAM 12614] [Roseibium aggregatum IAM 12614]